MPQHQKPWRPSANIPAVLKQHVMRRVISEEYDGVSQYLLALVLMDLICQLQHQIMPQLLQKPPRIVDAFVDSLLEHPQGVVDPRELGGWLEKKINQLIKSSKFDPSELHIHKREEEDEQKQG
jgi:hypothetical protein